MAAQPGEGTDVPDDIDIHTTAGKLADLDRRLDEAVHAGSAKAIKKQHAKGRKTADRCRASSSSSTKDPSSKSIAIRSRISDGTIPAYQCGRRPIRIRLEDLESALRRIPSARW